MITGAAGGIGAAAAALFRAEGATVVGVDLRDDFEGVDLALAADVASEEAVVIGFLKRAREEYGRIDVLFNNAGISPDDDVSVLDTSLGGVAARAGREPAQRLPVLQARHPAPARRRRRVGHQHRVVRGRDGRGDVADLLHGLQGRGAGACRASSAWSSPAAACA